MKKNSNVMEDVFMDNLQYCAFCNKQFEESEKPFIPVRSEARYHWQCYIKKVKETQESVLYVEEYEENFIEI